MFPDPTYATGDLVCRDGDGRHWLIGRRDHQIKVRGHRVELGEIEAVLTDHPAVGEAVVVPAPAAEEGETTFIAFLGRAGDVSQLELKRHCAERLPRYMVPGSIRVLDALPRGSTGKVDRVALAAADGVQA